MHENQEVNIVSRDNIKPFIQLCLQTERDRGLSKNSIWGQTLIISFSFL
jgi:hypothetical protein